MEIALYCIALALVWLSIGVGLISGTLKEIKDLFNKH